MEAKTQKRLIDYLKSKGCYVIKTKPGPGVPVGCPDVIALHRNWWGAFEVKASAKAPFRALQEHTLMNLRAMGMARVVFPENFDEIIKEIESML